MGAKWHKRSEPQYHFSHFGAFGSACRRSFPQQSLLSRHEDLTQSRLISQFPQIPAQLQGCVCLCCLPCCRICCDSPCADLLLYGLPRVLLFSILMGLLYLKSKNLQYKEITPRISGALELCGLLPYHSNLRSSWYGIRTVVSIMHRATEVKEF